MKKSRVFIMTVLVLILSTVASFAASVGEITTFSPIFYFGQPKTPKHLIPRD